jgi:hypothetical protein
LHEAIMMRATNDIASLVSTLLLFDAENDVATLKASLRINR